MVWCDRRSGRHPRSRKAVSVRPSGCAADFRHPFVTVSENLR